MSLEGLWLLRVLTVGKLSREHGPAPHAPGADPALGLQGAGSSVNGFLSMDKGQEGRDGKTTMCSIVQLCAVDLLR